MYITRSCNITYDIDRTALALRNVLVQRKILQPRMDVMLVLHEFLVILLVAVHAVSVSICRCLRIPPQIQTRRPLGAASMTGFTPALPSDEPVEWLGG